MKEEEKKEYCKEVMKEEKSKEGEEERIEIPFGSKTQFFMISRTGKIIETGHCNNLCRIWIILVSIGLIDCSLERVVKNSSSVFKSEGAITKSSKCIS